MKALLCVLVPLLVPAAASAGSGSTPAKTSKTYGRALDRALARAETRLLGQTRLWVDHSTWDNAWRVRTANYEVRTTQDRAFALDIAQGQEAMLGHFGTLLKNEYRPSRPFLIEIHPTLTAYNQFGEDHGAEHSSFYGSFYPSGHPDRPVATFYSPHLGQLRMWITHSSVHQYIDGAYPRQPPASISEGLASYFALYWDFGYGISELAKLEASGSFIPLRTLLAAPEEAFVNESQARLIELGMLMAYLLHYRDDTRTLIEDDVVQREPFADYLRLVLGGGDASGHPVHALIFEHTDQLEADFRAFDWGR